MAISRDIVPLINGSVHELQPRGAARRSDPGIEWISITRLARGSQTLEGMVGRSRQLREIFAAIERLKPYRSPILIIGETGTGKELMARALHRRGPYADGPFVVFNCCNFVEALAESQLFGHVKGAFTDASQDAQGCFRAANNGTRRVSDQAVHGAQRL